MATLRNRERSPRSSRSRRGQYGLEAADSSGEFLGFDQEKVEQNPDQFFGELFQGAHFRSVNLPERAAAGEEITISGRVHFDAPTQVVTTVGMRVRISSPSLSEDITQRFRSIKHCNERRFSLQVPVPEAAGKKFTYTVHAESTKLLGGWRTDSVRGPINLDILSSTENAVADGFNLLPYIAGGAGAGYVANQAFGDPRRSREYLVGGALFGAGFKRYGPALSVDIPTPSNTQLALGAAIVLGSVVLLNQSGLSGVLSASGEAAGSAIRAGTDAVKSATNRQN